MLGREDVIIPTVVLEDVSEERLLCCLVSVTLTQIYTNLEERLLIEKTLP